MLIARATELGRGATYCTDRDLACPALGRVRKYPRPLEKSCYCDVLAGSIARKGKLYVPGIYIPIPGTYYSRTSTRVHVSMLIEETFRMGLNVRRSLSTSISININPGMRVIRIRDFFVFRFFFFPRLSSGGWGKLELRLTTLPRVFIRSVLRVTARNINSSMMTCDTYNIM